MFFVLPDLPRAFARSNQDHLGGRRAHFGPMRSGPLGAPAVSNAIKTFAARDGRATITLCSVPEKPRMLPRLYAAELLIVPPRYLPAASEQPRNPVTVVMYNSILASERHVAVGGRLSLPFRNIAQPCARRALFFKRWKPARSGPPARRRQ